MKLRVLLAVVATVGAVGFASAQKTTTVEITGNEARMTDAVSAVHARPLVCDVKMKTYYQSDPKTGAINKAAKNTDLSWCIENDFHKIEKETSRFTDYWFLSREDFYAVYVKNNHIDVENLKNYAMFRSQQYHKCDVILAPVFNYRTATNDEKGAAGDVYLTLTVMGFAGDFINFRQATMEDFDLLKQNAELEYDRQRQGISSNSGKDAN
ncbi:MAG: hypothetical protein IKP73_17675 [Bacteroidales bacterium]|jgi:hypothetical protein|nr:hypothetical protein [Bacteroidales bacterium]MBR4327346.1 hypothetical protein [Bacteroidales bacterium]